MIRGLTAGLLFWTGMALGADQYADLFREAAAYTQQGKYEEAVSKYRAALLLRPGAAEALNNLALMYYELGTCRRAAVSLAIGSAIGRDRRALRRGVGSPVGAGRRVPHRRLRLRTFRSRAGR
jgi:tetratricopeptide (TPR) repeat protein